MSGIQLVWTSPHLSMNLCMLEESEVLSITLNQNHLCLEMVICVDDGESDTNLRLGTQPKLL